MVNSVSGQGISYLLYKENYIRHFNIVYLGAKHIIYESITMQPNESFKYIKYRKGFSAGFEDLTINFPIMIHLPWSMTPKRYICNIRNTIMSLLRQIKNKLQKFMTIEFFFFKKLLLIMMT